MHTQDLWHSCLKIGILTGIILAVFHFIYMPLSGTAWISYAANTNTANFQAAGDSHLGSIWVALSTRIGIKFETRWVSSSTQSFYREITAIWESPQENRAIRSDMIRQNMLIIKEYLNLSKTDVNSMLKSSSNRRTTLESFISQLEMRYKTSALSEQNLQKQKELLLKRIEAIEGQIEQVKTQMETDFSASLPDETLSDVDQYFALRAEYTELFTDIVFINQFLKQHQFLNEYNKWILDTLINNKEALINQSYVVIPDSGEQYLRPLELLFDEAEIKALQTPQE